MNLTKKEEIALQLYVHKDFILLDSFKIASKFIKYSHEIGADEVNNPFTKEEIVLLQDMINNELKDIFESNCGSLESHRDMLKTIDTKLEALCK